MHVIPVNYEVKLTLELKEIVWNCEQKSDNIKVRSQHMLT